MLLTCDTGASLRPSNVKACNHSSGRSGTNSFGTSMCRYQPGGRKFRRMAGKSAYFQVLRSGIGWCKVRSSSSWSQSLRPTSNQDLLDIVPNGQRMKRLIGWPERSLFDFRRIRSRRGAWRAHYTPQLKKRTALLRKLKDVFRRYQSQPASRVVQLINPVLRGWVNYFAVGHSSECFSMIQDWVEKKIRRHMGRAQNRKGFGWKRWSRQWLYESLQLFDSYRVRRPPPKVAPAG